MRIILIIFSSILALFFVSLLGQYLFKNQFEKIVSFLPQEQQSEIQNILAENKTFRAKNNRLKVTYPSYWIEIPIAGREISYGKILFMAGKFTLEGKTAQLIINEIPLAQKTAQELLSQMQEINKKQGWKLTVLSSQEKEDGFVFDALYTGPKEERLRSKEKILIDPEDKAYVVAVLANESDWGIFESDANQIIEATVFAPL